MALWRMISEYLGFAVRAVTIAALCLLIANASINATVRGLEQGTEHLIDGPVRSVMTGLINGPINALVTDLINGPINARVTDLINGPINTRVTDLVNGPVRDAARDAARHTVWGFFPSSWFSQAFPNLSQGWGAAPRPRQPIPEEPSAVPRPDGPNAGARSASQAGMFDLVFLFPHQERRPQHAADGVRAFIHLPTRRGTCGACSSSTSTSSQLQLSP